jgi:hypothetical protein
MSRIIAGLVAVAGVAVVAWFVAWERLTELLDVDELYE